MRLGTCANALAVSLGLLTVAPAAAQPSGRVVVAGNKANASKWFRAESPRFVVYSDAAAEDVTLLLAYAYTGRGRGVPHGCAPGRCGRDMRGERRIRLDFRHALSPGKPPPGLRKLLEIPGGSSS
jgi:hypothetical protein